MYTAMLSPSLYLSIYFQLNLCIFLNKNDAVHRMKQRKDVSQQEINQIKDTGE